MSSVDTYIKDIEKQNEDLRLSLDRYALIIGASYQIDVVDISLDTLNFRKIINYYIESGWELLPKREVSEQKRRWEYFSLPLRLQEKIGNKTDYFSIYKQPFSFPYKPIGKTMTQKYGPQTIEALNKFNIMLNTQAKLENKLTLEIYDYWVRNFRE